MYSARYRSSLVAHRVGIWAGFKSAPLEQKQLIDKKFEDLDVTNAFKYVGGYALGIVEGIGLSIKGLVEAVITLIKLPYDINQFLMVKVPELAVRYGPRIAQFLSEGGGLSERIKTVIKNFFDHPAKSVRQISSFLDALIVNPAVFVSNAPTTLTQDTSK